MHIFWWSIYGPFAPADSCGLYPDKLQVIQHYLKKRGSSHIELAERIRVRPRTTYDLLADPALLTKAKQDFGQAQGGTS